MTDNNESLNIDELHWHLGLLQNLNVGLVVLDQSYQVQLWNGFMSNHSEVGPAKIREKNLFDVFPELPVEWLRRKIDSVFQLKSPAYITWEQKPYLFDFRSQRPITGVATHMYQNVTLMPLTSPTGQVEFVSMMIDDVTDVAVSRIALEEVNGQLQTLSREDRLTGLFNRGHWQECLDLEVNRFMRGQEACTLILLDIDHFKAVNDNYGHPAGDEVIRKIAALMAGHARKTDIVGRYGGEEFGVILPHTSATQAEVFAERLRRAAELLDVEFEGQVINITISLGIAELQVDVQDAEQWIGQADEALYRSKQNGRNQFNIYNHE